MYLRPKIFAFSAICLGLGILLAVFLPACVLVVLAALIIILIGILCLKC